ncbi:thioesterase II family protein [Lentzea sp.]|uniref:thioesterase II family protein n=1 Tax=Lentzea sp. TaxID=56099 RepID=UPI002C71B42A|nr:alpha/beta fold hydrolase [Lentzea sp.]HUQ55216.1 alpha/beta fold hydrolase [Lentzea sp.]
MRPQVFCFPYAGGSARAYVSLRQALREVADLHLIELPGRGGRIRDRPTDRLAPLLDDLVPALLPHLDQPIVLFGHSLGAVLAFEIARLLRRRHGTVPARLIVSGHRAPHLPLREAEIHHLSDDAFVARLRELNGTPEEVLRNEDLMRMLLPALRADFTVSERYRFSPDDPLDCPISVYGGTKDPDIPVTDLHAWSWHTTRRCRVDLFTGDHFFLHTQEAALIKALCRDLRSPEAAPSARAGRSRARMG